MTSVMFVAIRLQLNRAYLPCEHVGAAIYLFSIFLELFTNGLARNGVFFLEKYRKKSVN